MVILQPTLKMRKGAVIS